MLRDTWKMVELRSSCIVKTRRMTEWAVYSVERHLSLIEDVVIQGYVLIIVSCIIDSKARLNDYCCRCIANHRYAREIAIR